VNKDKYISLKYGTMYLHKVVFSDLRLWLVGP